MSRIRFDFGALSLEAELLDTPTAKAVLAALPVTASVLYPSPSRESRRRGTW